MEWCFLRIGFLGLVLILLFPLAFSQLEITEVMYNPPGTDTNHEWIEIYNSGNESVNASNWFLRERKDEKSPKHALMLFSGNSFLLPEQYAVISSSPSAFLADNSQFSGSVFDSAFTLTNSGKELGLSDKNGKNTNTIFYMPQFGADGNGKTLCLISVGFGQNYSWMECGATPGQENLISISDNKGGTLSKDLKLSLNAPENLYSKQKYTNLFKLSWEGKQNCSLKDGVAIKYNFSGPSSFSSSVLNKEVGCSSTSGTGDFFFQEGGTYEICGEAFSNFTENNYADNSLCRKVEVKDVSSVKCDLALTLELQNLNETNIYNQGEHLKINPNLNDKSYPYQIEYWIEDLFGNIIKEKIATVNTNQKLWSIDVEEEDRVLQVKAQVYPACNDGNPENNYAEKMIIAVNKNFWQEKPNDPPKLKANSSKISISKIAPEILSFGKLAKADLKVYKGNTAKYSISAWIEKDGKEISEKTKINLKSKYTSYELTLPIQLDSNCDGKLKEGNAVLIVEGLGERGEEKVEVSGLNDALCKVSKSIPSSKSTTPAATNADSKFRYDISQMPAFVISDSPIDVKVLLSGDKQEHQVRLWSYLYRGSKCYSCNGEERENNEMEVLLQPNEKKEVILEMFPDSGLEEGEYSVKVKINKDNQKTDYELTDKITFKNKKKESLKTAADSFNELSGEGKDTSEKIYSEKTHLDSSGMVVYESSNEKAKQLAPWILAIAFGIACLVLIMKD